MSKTIKILAIIPARGGSKRLPKKNILELEGKPLISYTIEAAKKSIYLSDIVVSSDDLDILEVAKSQKVETIHRPKEIAKDTSPTNETIEHVINSNPEYRNYDFFILLQPTSPLRTSKHIDEAVRLLLEKDANSVISVTKPEHSPLWTGKIEKDLSLDKFLDNEYLKKRSQDLPIFYGINGAIYICNINEFLKEQSLYLKTKNYAYIMNRRDSIDIDEEIDFILAKELLRKR